MSSSLSTVEGGVQVDAEALRKLASLQAMGSAMERRYATPPPDFTRYKVLTGAYKNFLFVLPLFPSLQRLGRGTGQ